MTEQKDAVRRTKKITLPLIPLRGLVVFPFMILHFDVARKKSIASLEQAMVDNQQVFLVTQNKIDAEEPAVEDLYSFGVVANVKQLLKLPNGNIRVLVEGAARAKLLNFEGNDRLIVASVRVYPEVKAAVPEERRLEVEALIRTAKDEFDIFASLNPRIPNDSSIAVLNISDPGELADLIAGTVLSELDDKIEILSETNPERRLKKLVSSMQHELEILRLERDISEKVKSELDKNQRDYYLREQMKVIQEELDGEDGVRSETEEYRRQLKKLNMPESSKAKIEKEINRLQKMQPMSADASVLRGYLEMVFSLPWNVSTKESFNLKKVQSILDSDHYALDKVKERVVEFLAVKKLAGSKKGDIICLVGPPGVGKTSIAKSIARALGRKYVRMSLGGVKDEAEIRGHRKTYIGAMPGRIISAVNQAQSRNPLILLDEIDKMSSSYSGDPAAAMLEVLDGEQNFAFRDHYLEIPFDLSDVMFMTTANSLDTVPRPLLDRMEIIELSSYTETEKAEIAQKFIIPKQKNLHGLTAKQLKISEGATHDIINFYTREAGVRNLEREIAAVCRKAVREIVDNDIKKIIVTPLNLSKYLGRRRFIYDYISEFDEIGVVNGLAWTSVGGDTLKVEVNIMDGDGKVQLTGKLGDVMKESAFAAISYLRANAKKYGLNSDFHSKNDIHIHVPEGAVPKDGPSAGVTMATALLSALSRVPVRRDVAMTGEITIRGYVLPIGGLKEKTIAAYRAGVKAVIIPKQNEADIADIPSEVADGLRFVPVTHIDEVFENALLAPSAASPFRFCRDISDAASGKDCIKQ